MLAFANTPPGPYRQAIDLIGKSGVGEYRHRDRWMMGFTNTLVPVAILLAKRPGPAAFFSLDFRLKPGRRP